MWLHIGWGSWHPTSEGPRMSLGDGFSFPAGVILTSTSSIHHLEAYLTTRWGGWRLPVLPLAERRGYATSPAHHGSTHRDKPPNTIRNPDKAWRYQCWWMRGWNINVHLAWGREAQCIMGDRSCSYTAYSCLHQKEAFTDDWLPNRKEYFPSRRGLSHVTDQDNDHPFIYCNRLHHRLSQHKECDKAAATVFEDSKWVSNPCEHWNKPPQHAVT